MRDINSMSRINALAPTHAVRTIRQRSCNQKVRLVVCYVVWLGFMKGIGPRTSARCGCQGLVRMAIELK